jgi:hypothetical protein
VVLAGNKATRWPAAFKRRRIMACPNCGHTLEAIIAPGPPGTIRAAICHWCPRCGTVRCGPQTWTPKLAERCRMFERDVVILHMTSLGEWFRLGIAESIRPQDEGLLPSARGRG